MAYSSFDNAQFRVEADDTNWYPNIAPGDDGQNVYECSAIFDSKNDSDKMYKKLSIVTWKRPLGTMAVIGHMEAGYGTGQLRVPIRGGERKSYKAVLVGMSDIQSYAAKSQGPETRAKLSFVILSDPTG